MRTKHGNKRHEAVVGGQRCRFDSMAEHRYAEWLERERKAKRIKSWEHHPKALEVVDALTQERLCKLAVDFRVDGPTGTEWHEVKGMATSVWRLKRRLLDVLTSYNYVVIDAGRGVCASGTGAPSLFDERPKRKRRVKPSAARRKGGTP